MQSSNQISAPGIEQAINSLAQAFQINVGELTAWTPTLSGRFTDSKWNKTCYYIEIGDMVYGSIELVANATSPMAGGSSDCIFTLPVPAFTPAVTSNVCVIGMANAFPVSQLSIAHIGLVDSATALFRTQTVSGSNVIQQLITSTVPQTWKTGSEIGGFFCYRKA